MRNYGNSYTMDAWGNLTNKDVTKCQAEYLNEIASETNRFEPADPSAGRYDAAGNMVNYGAYAFDAESRIKSAGGTTYAYDGDGNRVAKTGNSNEVYWLGAGGDALAESDAAGNITNEYVFFGGKRVARVDSSGVHFYISDHLGSATVIANASGQIEREEMYFPYGGERWTFGSDSNHYKFTGKERDWVVRLITRASTSHAASTAYNSTLRASPSLRATDCSAELPADAVKHTS